MAGLVDYSKEAVNLSEGRPRRKASDVAKTKIREYYNVNKPRAVSNKKIKKHDENVSKTKPKLIQDVEENETEYQVQLPVLVSEKELAIVGTDNKDGSNLLRKKTNHTTQPLLRTSYNEPLVVYGNWQLALALAQSAQKHPLSYKMVSAHKNLGKSRKIVLC